jgi:hypothetical protein
MDEKNGARLGICLEFPRRAAVGALIWVLLGVLGFEGAAINNLGGIFALKSSHLMLASFEVLSLSVVL